MIAGSVTAAAVLVAGALVTVTDSAVFPHLGTGIWWAAATITTVGYGDVVPVTGVGRVIGGALMFGGVGALAFVTAVAASAIVVGEVEDEEHEIQAHERRLERQVAALDARMARIEQLLRATEAAPQTVKE